MWTEVELRQANRLVRFIRDHGVTAWVNADGDITALEVATMRADDGEVVRADAWVTLPADARAVRDWLGY